MGKSQRTKGHQFEREIARMFREIGFPDARRQLEYHEDDAQGVDIQGTGEFKIQCKRHKKYVPVNKIEEIQNLSEHETPILITKADRKEAMAVLPLKDLLELINYK